MEVHVEKGLEWMNASLTLTDFSIRDLFAKCDAFPFLLESVPDEGLSGQWKVLSVAVKLKPLDGKSDLELTVKNQAHFYLIGNMVTLLGVRRMFQEATAKEGYDFSFYTTAAAQKAREYILSGQQALTSMMAQGPDDSAPPAPALRA